MHNIEYRNYPLNVNRKSVQKELDAYAAYEDRHEGCSGLYRDIRWIENGISENYDEAIKRIEINDREDYDQLAVKYKQYHPVKTKKLDTLRERFAEATKLLYEKERKIHYSAENVSVEFVSCRNCHSRFATKYLKTNVCPMCKEDLRPISTLENIENTRKKVAALKEQIKQEENKGKFDVRWLVKIEYHT